jgi:hypothetical protein
MIGGLVLLKDGANVTGEISWGCRSRTSYRAFVNVSEIFPTFSYAILTDLLSLSRRLQLLPFRHPKLAVTCHTIKRVGSGNVRVLDFMSVFPI